MPSPVRQAASHQALGSAWTVRHLSMHVQHSDKPLKPEICYGREAWAKWSASSAHRV